MLDLNQINAELEGKSPEQILRWAVETFSGRICMQSSMQRRTSTLARMLHAEGIQRGVPVLFVDTGYHFPATLETRDVLSERYDLDIVTLSSKATPDEQAEYFGRELWQHADGYKLCCELRKVRPFLEEASRYDAVISGLQRDQGGARSGIPVVSWDPRIEAYKIHPLATWTREQVDAYNADHDVFVNPLHGRGYPSIGCAPCTTPVYAGEGERAGRWRHIREMLEAEQEQLYCDINYVDHKATG